MNRSRLDRHQTGSTDPDASCLPASARPHAHGCEPSGPDWSEALHHDVARASQTDNPTWRWLHRGSAIAILAGATAGCSLSFPIAGFTADHTATGSIGQPSVFLSPALDREDLRRARAALSVALDPQGNGDRVGWLNPQTGAHGSFAAVAPPFAEHDRVCRAFAAEVVPEPGSQRHVSGSACREDDGTWKLLDEARPKA